MTKAIDSATSITSATAQALKDAGIRIVARYLTGAFAMTTDEVHATMSAGLKIISIYETNPTNVDYFTQAQGISDAQAAVQAATGLGQPIGTPIYFTVDYDAQVSDLGAISDYFAGIRSAIGQYKVGLYGSYRVVTSTIDTDYRWQTLAWSGGQVASNIHLYQSQNDVQVGGIGVDTDEIYQEPGCWTLSYPSVPVQINGKSYDAVSVGSDPYVIWTAFRDVGVNLTLVNFGDVEINGIKPTQVTQNGNTYIICSALPNLQATALSGGGFNYAPLQTQSEAPDKDAIQVLIAILQSLWHLVGDVKKQHAISFAADAIRDAAGIPKA